MKTGDDQRVTAGASRSGRRWLKRVALGAGAAIACVLAGSAASNLLLPGRSEPLDRLDDIDKAYVLEAFNLRRTFGDSLWPGWSSAHIPVVLYNEQYAFLVGIDTPASGWRTLPRGGRQGGPWEVVGGDSLSRKHYYYQRLLDESSSPQAFTVRIGECWAASMTTTDWMTIKMGNEFRDGLPPVVRHVIPYRILARIFLGLAMSTEGYVCAIAHEGFHAYQGMVAPDRLASAEQALGLHGERYPWEDPSFNSAWENELNVLADAIQAEDKATAQTLGAQFLAMRRDRRVSARLDSALVSLERQREWEEGLGKYTELWLWQRAGADSTYVPDAALRSDSEFKGYRNFHAHWNQELLALRLQSHGNETRFYYAGMAQGFLLDRVAPEWRGVILQEDKYLEDLLHRAIGSRRNGAPAGHTF